jgi:hypothetical protein
MQETSNPSSPEQEETEDGSSDAEKLLAVRILKTVEAFKAGRLTYQQFRKLPTDFRQEYERRVGRPLADHEQVGRKRQIAKRKAAQKMARKSRQRNRR